MNMTRASTMGATISRRYGRVLSSVSPAAVSHRFGDIRCCSALSFSSAGFHATPNIASTDRICRSRRSLPAVGGRGPHSQQRRMRSTQAGVFPSIVIDSNGVRAQGSFAEAQAEFLDPDPEAVETLTRKLAAAKMGIVAHYYMDVELQSVLQAAGQRQQSLHPASTVPLISVADSLKMGDHAVEMCKSSLTEITSISCLGVDFMAESVAAILGKNGFGHIPVYRATREAIGCSLAESAERRDYRAWLTNAASKPDHKALHVVYINTSLETKAVSSSIVPTITCTSSNVLKTILTAHAQVPDLNVYYGPDTYMGDNLVTMLDTILRHTTQETPEGERWNDERIQKELHPDHNVKTLGALRDAIHVFPNGNCVVHHMFGAEVVDIVKQNYDNAYVTAHLEVPGEMFQIAMEKSLVGRGACGSTSDILNFISAKVSEASSHGEATRLQFILGTEAGMITSIVRSVQNILAQQANLKIEAEIIFPVASDAITKVDGDDDFAIVPGVSGGEGCSTAGGCATCPFMKMNSLDALGDVMDMIINNTDQNQIKLKGHLPPDRLANKQLGGMDATDLGTQPIMYMRDFMMGGKLPQELVNKIEEGAK